MQIMRGRHYLVFALCLSVAVAINAETLNTEMTTLAASLTKAIAAKGLTNVAAVDFTDLQGQPTELGRYLSERLAVEMVMVGGVSVLDRANIKSILAEHKLTEAGLVNPANARKLGEFAGVDVILIGNVTTLDDIELIVKGISTESAAIVAAGRITFPKTADIQQLLNRGISPLPTVTAGAPAAEASATVRPKQALAFKDIGSLRILLQSCISVKSVASSAWGRSLDGIRCSFEFSNLATQTPLFVALNASEPKRGSLCSDYDIGRYLRTTLVDDRGVQWVLPNSGVTGLGMVGVGKKEGGCADAYNPTEIATLLPRFDDTGSNVARSRAGEYRYVFGSVTTLSPGQSRTATMTFMEDSSRDPSPSLPKTFQLQCELVLGVGSNVTTRRSYALENITLDQISMPRGVR